MKRTCFGVLLSSAFILLGSTSCQQAYQHADNLSSSKEREFTLGIVQKEITKGMSQADVATALGSPNIVTKDKEGQETWIYDKIASEASYSQSSASGGLLLGIISSPLGLGGSAGGSKSAGASSSTKKTLTVVIKFNDAGLVDSYSYHSSKF